MPRYRVLVKSFIDNVYIDPETMSPEQCIVEYNGKPGTNLQLIEDDAAEAKPQKGFRKAAKDAE